MPSTPLSRRAQLPLLTALGVAAVLFLLPMPGSLSVVGTRWLAGLGTGLPRVDLVSEVGLAALAAATAAAILFAWFRRPDRRLPVAAAAFAGVVALGRVMQGVHYVHDIALGATFGVVVTGVVVLATAGLAARRERGGTRR